MTYRELKAKLDTMNDKQLDWPVVIFEGDDERGYELDSFDELDEDVYWMDGDCYGMIDGAKDAIKEDETLTIDDFTVIPKGTVTLHYNMPE